MIKSINPYNGRVVFENKILSRLEVDLFIDEAQKAFISWRKTTFEYRSNLILNLAKVLIKNKYEYAKIMSLEMGKPISQSIAEIDKCIWLCEYYADNGEKQLSSKKIVTEAKTSYIKYEPLGVILGVMPWNYPFWQVIRFAVPTIMAGNVALLKHASNVQESAKCIQNIFKNAGFPDFIFTNLAVGSIEVENIIRNRNVKGISLTGSKFAGSAVASIAGEEIKPSLLELGGNNALVVFDDCNMEKTIKTVINARFQNTGQSCIAGKRLLLHHKIADDFLNKLKLEIEKIQIGDPLNKDTFLSVMVSDNAAKELYNQLDESVNMGAEIVIGGNYNNAFFEPTLVKNVTENMPIFKEETFGPLLTTTIFYDENEAVDLVNKSDFGLGVSIFTQNKRRINALIPEFNDGAVFVNELVKSDPRLPFGGTKTSGYGRELSKEGIMAFVNVKTVYIEY